MPFIWGCSPILEEGGMVCTSRYTAAHLRWATDVREVAVHPAFTFSQKNFEIFFERKNTMKTTKFSIGRILVALLLVLTMAFSFVGCNDDTPDRLAALEQAKADLTAALAEVKAVADAAATKTALDAAQAAIATLQTGSATKEELKAATDKLTEVEEDLALVATDAEVAAIKTALEATINTAKTALEAKDAEFTTAIANLKTSADGVAGLIDTKVAALKTELEGKIKALSDKVDAIETAIADLEDDIANLNGAVGDLSDADKAHKAEYEDLKAAVEALDKKLDGLTDPNGEGLASFVEGYKAATALLYEVKENGEPGDFSAKNFQNKYNAVAENSLYKATDRGDFKEKYDLIYLKLARATSVAEIKDAFAELDAAIEAMPTLAEMLEDEINKIDFLKADPATAETMERIVALRTEMGTNIEAELEAKYDSLKAAYDNLVAAAEYLNTTYKDAVNALPGTVLLNDSKAALEDIADMFDAFVSTYFADDAVNAYYYAVPEDDAEATDEVNAAAKKDAQKAYAIKLAGNDYVTAKAKIDRHAALVALVDTKTLTDYTATFGVTMLPLYNNTEIPTEWADVEKWLADNKLDVELEAGITHNVYTLLGEDKYETLEAANTYVKAMNEIYTTMVKGESVDLIKDINDIVAVEVLTLTADEQNAKGIREDIDAVEAAIKAVTNYAVALDENFVKMLEAADTAKFASVVEARMEVLNNAKGAYAALLDQVDNILAAEIDYSDYKDIEAFKATSAQYVTDYALVAAHYDEVGKTAVDEYLAGLDAAYDLLIAEIVVVYEEARALLDKLEAGALLLSDGHAVNEINGKLKDIIRDMGVDNTDIPLGDGEANLNDLYAEFAGLVVEYGKKAVAAQTGAATVTDLMNTTWGADATTYDAFAKLLQNADAIDAVVSAFDTWYTAHLAGETGTKADVLAAIAGIKIFGADGNYDFVTAAEYALICDMDTKSQTAQDAAAAKLAEIDAMLDAFRANGAVDAKLVTVPAADDVKAIFDAIVDYYKTFWNDDFTIDAVATDPVITKTYETLTEYAHLTLNTTKLDDDGITEDAVEVYVISKYKLAQATTDMEAIKTLIDALPTGNYAQIATDSEAILEALKAFYDNYYNGAVNNTLFSVADDEGTEDIDETVDGDEYILNFHKKYCVAELEVAYAAKVVADALSTEDAELLYARVVFACELINEAEDLENVELGFTNGKNTIDNFVATPVAP